MNRLFTYTIPVDDGAAPNPFDGICTLAICKPSIRRIAQVGDWIAGLGAKNAPSGDLSGKLVYAMRVQEVLSMREYDIQAKSRWPNRVPNTSSLNLQDRLGDCIYDFSCSPPAQRRSVHNIDNMKTDLNGKNVLVSKEFYYFGSSAIPLPSELKSICHQTQGHKSNSNKELFIPFVEWIRGQDYEPGLMHGWPDYIVKWSNGTTCNGCRPRVETALNDC